MVGTETRLELTGVGVLSSSGEDEEIFVNVGNNSGKRGCVGSWKHLKKLEELRYTDFVFVS